MQCSAIKFLFSMTSQTRQSKVSLCHSRNLNKASCPGLGSELTGCSMRQNRSLDLPQSPFPSLPIYQHTLPVINSLDTKCKGCTDHNPFLADISYGIGKEYGKSSSKSELACILWLARMTNPTAGVLWPKSHFGQLFLPLVSTRRK